MKHPNLRILIVLALVSCQAEEDPVEKYQTEFFEDKLMLDEQSACNKKDRTFDPLEEDGLCTKIALAEFDCTPKGLRERLEDNPHVNPFMDDVEEYIEDGFKLANCGEDKDSGRALLVFHWKKTDGNTAEVKIEVMRPIFESNRIEFWNYD